MIMIRKITASYRLFIAIFLFSLVLLAHSTTATSLSWIMPSLGGGIYFDDVESDENALKRGSKGEEVRRLQERLIELEYLTGSADGAFGAMTEQAVVDFQDNNSLSTTGTVGDETREKLFKEDAKKNPNPPFDPATYSKLNYKDIARYPDNYYDEYITFSGRIIQVVDDSGYCGEYRIATSGSYDNVVYVEYWPPDNAPRILEGDRVTVYACSTGIETYTTVLGATVSIPSFDAKRVEIKK